jgi:hypothetical protein
MVPFLRAVNFVVPRYHWMYNSRFRTPTLPNWPPLAGRLELRYTKCSRFYDFCFRLIDLLIHTVLSDLERSLSCKRHLTWAPPLLKLYDNQSYISWSHGELNDKISWSMASALFFFVDHHCLRLGLPWTIPLHSINIEIVKYTPSPAS